MKNSAGRGVGGDSDNVDRDCGNSLNLSSAQKMVDIVLNGLQALCHLHFTDTLSLHIRKTRHKLFK